MALPPRIDWSTPLWLACGKRTPFARVDGPLKAYDAIALSVPVVRAMTAGLRSGESPDLAIWGTVAPNLAYSNIAREVWLDAGLDPRVPAFSTVMACATSMAAAFAAAGMLAQGAGSLALVGGVETMSRVQAGLGQNLSDGLRRAAQARGWGGRINALRALRLADIRLQVQSVKNRTTGLSMGEHCEEMAKTWSIPRDAQDDIALASHRHAIAAQERGFFDDLIVAVETVDRDPLPRRDTSRERLAALKPVFDRTSGKGTITAGNASPLTDGAAGLWVATESGLARLPDSIPRVRLLDWEFAAVDLKNEGLLMAPAYAIPRLLNRHGLGHGDIALWEIHEAFAAQVLCNLRAIESPEFLRDRAGVLATPAEVPRERINPNGGSIALGHPFGATGARILSQAVQALATMPSGSRAIVSVCADGGLGAVALLVRP
ncbi:MAG: acetyl-CoA C-acyltransferase [Alphaproteobacteria bacterium]